MVRSPTSTLRPAIEPHVPIGGLQTDSVGGTPQTVGICREQRALPARPDFPAQVFSLRSVKMVKGRLPPATHLVVLARGT